VNRLRLTVRVAVEGRPEASEDVIGIGVDYALDEDAPAFLEYALRAIAEALVTPDAAGRFAAVGKRVSAHARARE
jgi:hypothetical protein